MALREIRVIGDEILGKVSKEVKEMTPRLHELITDMWDTMHKADGVGLAAVQVGVLKRIFVVEVDENEKCVLVNPVIISTEGTQEGSEGCLSVPGKAGNVTRPMKVVIEGYDDNMQPVRIEAEGFYARALCHEYDHLNGHLYTEKVEGDIYDVEP
jgi:peptide deformylase